MICQFGAEKVLKFIIGEGGTGSGNTQVRYLLLSSSAISLTGAGYAEPTAPSYARIKIGASGYTGNDSADYFGDVTAVTNSEGNITEWYITNKAEMHFLEAQESWGELTHFAITDSPNINTGNVYFAGELVSPIKPVANTIPIARQGAIRISIPTEYYVED